MSNITEPGRKLRYGLEIAWAVFAHEVLDLGDIVGPADGGEVHAGGLRHVVAGLQVVDHQKLRRL